MKTFLDKCISDEASADDIDDCIEEWHQNGRNINLCDYLGITHKEYSDWVNYPEQSENVISEKKMIYYE
jgi:hypothetical protein